LLSQAINKDDYKIIIASLAKNNEELSALADELIGRIDSGVVLLAGNNGEKLFFVAKATKDVVSKGVHCGNVVKAAAQASGGGGGGRPEFAQAGGKDVTKLDEALSAARVVLGV
jgi:alanyl-tRNA synthetase